MPDYKAQLAQALEVRKSLQPMLDETEGWADVPQDAMNEFVNAYSGGEQVKMVTLNRLVNKSSVKKNIVDDKRTFANGLKHIAEALSLPDPENLIARVNAWKFTGRNSALPEVTRYAQSVPGIVLQLETELDKLSNSQRCKQILIALSDRYSIVLGSEASDARYFWNQCLSSIDMRFNKANNASVIKGPPKPSRGGQSHQGQPCNGNQVDKSHVTKSIGLGWLSPTGMFTRANPNEYGHDKVMERIHPGVETYDAINEGWSRVFTRGKTVYAECIWEKMKLVLRYVEQNTGLEFDTLHIDVHNSGASKTYDLHKSIPLNRLVLKGPPKPSHTSGGQSHQGQACKPGWSASRTGCTPKKPSSGGKTDDKTEGNGTGQEGPKKPTQAQNTTTNTEVASTTEGSEGIGWNAVSTALAGKNGSPKANDASAAAKRIPATASAVNQRITRIQGLLSKAINKAKKAGDQDTADGYGVMSNLLDMVQEHVAEVGIEGALKELGEEKNKPGSDKQVAYEGVWEGEGHFIDNYLKSAGITTTHSTGGRPSKGLQLISSWTPEQRAQVNSPYHKQALAAGVPPDFIPPDPKIQNKLQEAKRLPGLESSEDISKLMGKSTSRLGKEEIAKLDSTYGKGKWIIKSYGAEAYAGFGIYFPERMQQMQQDAKSDMVYAKSKLQLLGFDILRDKKGDAIGITDTSTGSKYKFGSKEYNGISSESTAHNTGGSKPTRKLGGDVKKWGALAERASRNENGVRLPGSPEDELRWYGYQLHKKEGKVDGITTTDGSGQEFKFDTPEYDKHVYATGVGREGLDYWADRAATTAEYYKASGTTPNKFMAQPAFKAAGVTKDERAAGMTFETATEGRVHVITRNGKAEAIPYAMTYKGEQLPAVFMTKDIQNAMKTATDAINSLPESGRKGQVYAPDVLRTSKGYKVVEANPEMAGGGSGWLGDDPFVIDAYVSHILGRDPAHVKFIRRLLTEQGQVKKKGITTKSLNRLQVSKSGTHAGQDCKPGWSASRTGCTPSSGGEGTLGRLRATAGKTPSGFGNTVPMPDPSEVGYTKYRGYEIVARPTDRGTWKPVHSINGETFPMMGASAQNIATPEEAIDRSKRQIDDWLDKWQGGRPGHPAPTPVANIEDVAGKLKDSGYDVKVKDDTQLVVTAPRNKIREIIEASGNTIHSSAVNIARGTITFYTKGYTKSGTHAGQACKPGWSASRTGCTPALNGLSTGGRSGDRDSGGGKVQQNTAPNRGGGNDVAQTFGDAYSTAERLTGKKPAVPYDNSQPKLGEGFPGSNSSTGGKPLSRLKPAQQEMVKPSGPSQPLTSTPDDGFDEASAKPTASGKYLMDKYGNVRDISGGKARVEPNLTLPQNRDKPRQLVPLPPSMVGAVVNHVDRKAAVSLREHIQTAKQFTESMQARAGNTVQAAVRDIWPDCPNWVANTAESVCGAFDFVGNTAKNIAVTIFAPEIAGAVGASAGAVVATASAAEFAQAVSATAQAGVHNNLSNVSEAINPPLFSMCFVTSATILGGVLDRKHEGVWTAISRRANERAKYIIVGEGNAR